MLSNLLYTLLFVVITPSSGKHLNIVMLLNIVATNFKFTFNNLHTTLVVYNTTKLCLYQIRQLGRISAFTVDLIAKSSQINLLKIKSMLEAFRIVLKIREGLLKANMNACIGSSPSKPYCF
jgi:hypothetical protein